MNSLNEIIDQYPDAISFAPGAPYSGFLESLDIYQQIDRYTEYLGRKQNLTPKQVRRKLFQYSPSCGQIRDLVADTLGRDLDTDIQPDAVVITVGCQEAMLLVLRALRAGSNDVLAVVTPCYVGIVGAARFLDFEMLAVDEGETGIDLAGLEVACSIMRAKGKRLRAVYVAPDCANPSGSLMDLHTREALLTLASREGFLVLEDSTYSFTVTDDAELPSLKKLDRFGCVVYLGTFSKVCLPGARVGFVVAIKSCGTPHPKSVC